MESICVLSFLGINSYLDIRKGQISLCLAAVYAALGILYIIVYSQQQLVLLVGAVPGLLLLSVGKLSGGSVGMGDGLVVLVSGLYMGIWKALEFITLALLLAAVWAGFLMVFKKKGKQASFPFIPFLLMAYGLPWLIRAAEGWKG